MLLEGLDKQIGLNRVDRLDSSGLIASGYDELAGLTSGRMEIISNDTHVWVTSALIAVILCSSVLQGELLANGSVRWEYGYNFQQDVVNEMTLDGETLWFLRLDADSRRRTEQRRIPHSSRASCTDGWDDY